MIKPSELSLDRSLFLLAYLAVGGTESFAGPLAGAMPKWLRFSRGYRLAAFGLRLALVMASPASGLIPRLTLGRRRPKGEAMGACAEVR